jgi:hypothetical protein
VNFTAEKNSGRTEKEGGYSRKEWRTQMIGGRRQQKRMEYTAERNRGHKKG